MMPRWEIDDIVTPERRMKRTKGIRCGTPYRIVDISRCLDGATSWDDLKLARMNGTYVDGWFCEFDFKRKEKP